MRTIKSFFTVMIILLLLKGELPAQGIFGAADSGNLGEVQRLINSNRTLLDSVNKNGYTPLLFAAAKGNEEIALYLVTEGANLDIKDKRGYTALHFAADKNQLELARLLLQKGAKADAVTSYQTTPLFNAIEKKNTEVAKLLVEYHADVNFKSPVFGCPIHRVVYSGSPELLDLLIASKANIEATDPGGKSPLNLAAMLGKIEAAKTLIEHGADVNSKDIKGMTPLHWAIQCGQDQDAKNQSAGVAELLVNHGADVNTVSNDSVTALFSAAGRGYTGIVMLLHQSGANIRDLSKPASRTLLHVASIKGYGDLADYLLSQRVDKSLKDASGKTALDYALQFGNDRIAQKLSGKKETAGKSQAGSRYLHEKIPAGSAYLWLLNNRGWAIKTSDHLFVFDNEENGRKPDQPSVSNGWIDAPEIRDQDVIALYSAYHARAHTMEFIHAMEDSLKQVVYLHYKEDQWRGGRNSRYLAGREKQQFGTTEIIPYETHDSYNMGSLGYLVKTTGLTFFYPNFFPEDTLSFQKEIDYLTGQADRCDFAIIEVSQGMDPGYASYIIQKLKPRMVIPYDRSGRAESHTEFSNEIRRKFPHVEVRHSVIPGERIEYRK